MSYYSEPDSHIRDKVVLDLSHYATKKELNNAKDIMHFNLPAKTDFAAFKP